MAVEFNRKNFLEYVSGILPQYGFDFTTLKEAQENLLFDFISGHDCVGVLPTNYGKSLIFQLMPGVIKHFNPEIDPIIIVVTPINALIADQIKRCDEIGLTAVHLTQENYDIIKQGHFSMLFASPECLLNEKYREFLLSLSPRVTGIVIDEVHVVVKW